MGRICKRHDLGTFKACAECCSLNDLFLREIHALLEESTICAATRSWIRSRSTSRATSTEFSRNCGTILGKKLAPRRAPGWVLLERLDHFCNLLPQRGKTLEQCCRRHVIMATRALRHRGRRNHLFHRVTEDDMEANGSRLGHLERKWLRKIAAAVAVVVSIWP